MQNRQFSRKNNLGAFLIDLKCRWLESGLADFEKHKKNCIMAYGRFFTHF